MNKPVAWMSNGKEFYVQQDYCPDFIPLYTHPVKEQSTNERIEMLKEMVERIANPVGWLGYHEGHLVSFLQTQEQVNSFLTATDPTGKVEPVYTHPVKELTDEEIGQFKGEWYRGDYASFYDLVKAILRKAQEK